MILKIPMTPFLEEYSRGHKNCTKMRDENQVTMGKTYDHDERFIHISLAIVSGIKRTLFSEMLVNEQYTFF